MDMKAGRWDLMIVELRYKLERIEIRREGVCGSLGAGSGDMLYFVTRSAQSESKEQLRKVGWYRLTARAWDSVSREIPSGLIPETNTAAEGYS
jgi:hypothetical protein